MRVDFVREPSQSINLLLTWFIGISSLLTSFAIMGAATIFAVWSQDQRAVGVGPSWWLFGVWLALAGVVMVTNVILAWRNLGDLKARRLAHLTVRSLALVALFYGIKQI